MTLSKVCRHYEHNILKLLVKLGKYEINLYNKINKL